VSLSFFFRFLLRQRGRQSIQTYTKSHSLLSWRH
jgi:hypothetical protein